MDQVLQADKRKLLTPSQYHSITQDLLTIDTNTPLQQHPLLLKVEKKWSITIDRILQTLTEAVSSRILQEPTADNFKLLGLLFRSSSGDTNLSLSFGEKLLGILEHQICHDSPDQDTQNEAIALFLQLFTNLRNLDSTSNLEISFKFYKPTIDFFSRVLINALATAANHPNIIMEKFSYITVCIFKQLQQSYTNPKKLFITFTGKLMAQIIRYRWIFCGRSPMCGDIVNVLDEIVVEILFHADHLSGYATSLEALSRWTTLVDSKQDKVEAANQPRKKRKVMDNRKNSRESYHKTLFQNLSKLISQAQPEDKVPSDDSVPLVAFGPFFRMLVEGFATSLQVERDNTASSGNQTKSISKLRSTNSKTTFILWVEVVDMVLGSADFTELSAPKSVESLSVLRELFQMLLQLDIYKAADDDSNQSHLVALKNLTKDLMQIVIRSCGGALDGPILHLILDTVSSVLGANPALLEPHMDQLLKLCLSYESCGGDEAFSSANDDFLAAVISTYGSTRMLDRLVKFLLDVDNMSALSLTNWVSREKCHNAFQNAFSTLPQGQLRDMWMLILDHAVACFSEAKSQKDTCPSFSTHLFGFFVRSIQVSSTNCEALTELIDTTYNTTLHPIFTQDSKLDQKFVVCARLFYELVSLLDRSHSWVRTSNELITKMESDTKHKINVIVTKEKIICGNTRSNDAKRSVACICIAYIRLHHVGSLPQHSDLAKRLTELVFEYAIDAEDYGIVLENLQSMSSYISDQNARHTMQWIVRDECRALSFSGLLSDASFFEIDCLRRNFGVVMIEEILGELPKLVPSLQKLMVRIRMKLNATGERIDASDIADLCNNFRKIDVNSIVSEDIDFARIATYLSILSSIPADYIVQKDIGGFLFTGILLFRVYLSVYNEEGSGCDKLRALSCVVSWLHGLQTSFRKICFPILSSDEVLEQLFRLTRLSLQIATESQSKEASKFEESVWGWSQYFVDVALDLKGTQVKKLIMQSTEAFVLTPENKTNSIVLAVMINAARGDYSATCMQSVEIRLDLVEQIVKHIGELLKERNIRLFIDVIAALLDYYYTKLQQDTSFYSEGLKTLRPYFGKSMQFACTSIHDITLKTEADALVYPSVGLARACFRFLNRYAWKSKATDGVSQFEACGRISSLCLHVLSKSFVGEDNMTMQSFHHMALPVLLGLIKNASVQQVKLLLNTIKTEMTRGNLLDRQQSAIECVLLTFGNTFKRPTHKQCLRDFGEEIFPILLSKIVVTDVLEHPRVVCSLFKAICVLLPYRESLTDTEVQQIMSCLQPLYVMERSARVQDVSKICLNQLWLLSTSLLTRILKQYSQCLSSTVPLFIDGCHLLLRFIAKCSGEKVLAKEELRQWNLNLGRLYGYMKPHASVLRKHVVYVLVEYFKCVSDAGLSLDDQRHLRTGIHCLLEMCSVHEFAHLHAVLDPTAQSLFKPLHQEYKQHHKYMGKA